MFSTFTACRVCQNSRLESILRFGNMPLANRYLTKTTVSQPEPLVPLEVVLCMKCGCVQLAYAVDPKILFEEYLYTSSTSGSLAEHFRNYAVDTASKLKLVPGKDFIVGIGGNDGPLELAYQKLGFKVLNVEASRNIARLSHNSGVPTLNAWFTENAAKSIVREHGRASLITCNNCFAHMPNIHAVVRAIKILLQPGGWFICENAYWDDTVRGNHFDQIYHEHCFYWTIKALECLFRFHGLEIEHVEFNLSQGGSIRVFVPNDVRTISPTVRSDIKREEANRLFNSSTYLEWSRRIQAWKSNCRSFLAPFRSVSCYGVPAKFTMLSEQLQFTTANIQYAVEDSPIKVGLFTPGSHIPIVDREHFILAPTEYCIITATNYADRIIATNPQYKGTWLVLLPEPKVIER